MIRAGILSQANAIIRIVPDFRGAPLRYIIVLFSALMAFASIDRWHDWGGDYAYYLGVARNMFFDRPLETANGGLVAPNGFPWILSKLAPAVSWNIYALKLFNLIPLTVYFLLVGISSKVIHDKVAKATFVIISTVNVWLWFFSNQVLTEILFLTIITTIMTLILLARHHSKYFYLCLFGVFLMSWIACTIKGAGILLNFVPAAMLFERAIVFNRARFALYALPTISIGVAFAFMIYNANWFNPVSLVKGEVLLLDRALQALGKLNEELQGIWFMLTGIDGGPFFGVIAGVLLLTVGLVALQKKHLSMIALVGAIAVPTLAAEWIAHGGRYWFPLLAVFAYLIAEALDVLLPKVYLPNKLMTFFGGLLLSLFALGHVSYAKYNYLETRDRGVFEENAANMFYWVHYNTEWGKRICFFKPRILGYFANWNNVCALNVEGTAQDLESTLAERADFIVVSTHYRPEVWSYFNELADDRVVYRNKHYVVVSRISEATDVDPIRE